MKRRKLFWTIFLLVSGIGIVVIFAILFERAKGREIIRGIRKINRGQVESVPLSAKVTRILARCGAAADAAFTERMNGNGWGFVCNYGRSALYRKGDQEVLARKTQLPGGYCIYELLDENYIKHMKTETSEAV